MTNPIGLIAHKTTQHQATLRTASRTAEGTQPGYQTRVLSTTPVDLRGKPPSTWIPASPPRDSTTPYLPEKKRSHKRSQVSDSNSDNASYYEPKSKRTKTETIEPLRLTTTEQRSGIITTDILSAKMIQQMVEQPKNPIKKVAHLSETKVQIPKALLKKGEKLGQSITAGELLRREINSIGDQARK